MAGVDGPERMAALMTAMREHTPTELGGQRIVRLRDYKDGIITVPALGPVGRTELSGSNVLYFELANDVNFIIRPSGTEPKIKVYILARDKERDACRRKAEALAAWAGTLGKE